MNADVHALTGAYALDALDDAERALFERHLDACEACAQEVAELRATAARLGAAAAAEPPRELRARVRARVAVTRQQQPLVASLAYERTRRRWRRRAVWGAAAALLAVAVALGGVALHQRNRIDALDGQTHTMSQLLAAPDEHVTTGRVDTGGAVTVVSSRSLGTMAFTASGLASLPSSRAYQLWMIDPSGAVRAGPVLRAGSGLAGPVLATGLGRAVTIAMTVEPAAGSARPTSTPILSVALGS